MNTYLSLEETVLLALGKYGIPYSNIDFSEVQNELIVTLGRETEPSNLQQFTTYLAELKLNFKSTFQSQSGLMHIIVY